MKSRSTVSRPKSPLVPWFVRQPRSAVLLGLLLQGLIAAPRSFADPASGLIAHYTFDGSASDASGNGRHGQIVGATNFVAGILGQAIHLQGSGFSGTAGDHVLIPTPDFPTLNAFSVSLWVREQGMSHLNGEAYVSFGDHYGGGVAVAHFDAESFLSASLDENNTAIITPFDASGLGQWVHYCLTYSNGTQVAYRNGLQIGTLNHAVSLFGTNAGIGIHWWNRGASVSTRFIGDIDEVRIYNQSLSGVEVGQLFGGLAAYYPFDGNANDASGNSNHPVVLNGVTYATDRFGINHTAALFDGNSDIDYGTNALPKTGQSSFTVSFWINAGVHDAYVIGNSFGGADPGPYWSVQCENSPQDGLGVRLDLHDGTHGTPLDPTAVTTGPGVFGGWHHVCMVVDRWEQKASAYLDGAKRSSFDISQIGSLHNSNSLRMGWRTDWFKLNGLLDEVLIYNRVLTSAEITELASEPRLNIAVSQVRLCWNSRSNKTYQVQYRSALTTNTWLNLGSPIPGDGSTECITDDVAGPQKFYRAILVP